MAFIKKPIKKIWLYLSFLLGSIFALITANGIFSGTSPYNLSELKNKAECVFSLSGTISSAEAASNCWTTKTVPPAPPPGCEGCGGCGCGDGGGGGSSSGCCCFNDGGGGCN